MEWPPWWEWELELSPHVEKRMGDRGFNELDLRTMMQYASGYRPDFVEGRFVIETTHARASWRSLSNRMKWSIFSWSSPRTV